MHLLSYGIAELPTKMSFSTEKQKEKLTCKILALGILCFNQFA